MGSRMHRLLVARMALALMLFAQVVMAWSACDRVERSPQRVVFGSADSMPCHEGERDAACMAHCQSEWQAVQKVGFPVPAMPSAPVITVIRPVHVMAGIEVSQVPVSTFANGPPRRILLQSMQL